MAVLTLVALCAILSYAVAAPCGASGRQCIVGKSFCDVDQCRCIDPPYVWGDPYFMCYRQNTVAAESRNDPSLTTFNNETTDFPFPCRYLMTHVKQELKGRRRAIIGECEVKVHVFNKRGQGKIFTHGVDVAVRITYTAGAVVERSVRKYGTAANGVNNWVITGVQDYRPDGPWTPPETILYEDAPNNILLKVEEVADNNQIVFDFKACGISISFVPYDTEQTRQQPQIPGVSVGVNCAHHPQWLSVDQVIGLAPAWQGGHLLAEIQKPGLSVSQSLVHRAFQNLVPQAQPDAHPACSTTSASLAACDDSSRQTAFESCYWILTEPKFVKCAHKNGLDFVDLFQRCVAAWCQGAECATIRTAVQSCEILAGEIPQVQDFIDGDLCP
ncbi:hypothetical protein EGW08_022693 [Elysia chlorotica]|uniref:VWFD domain-containing protein n=1 Tax=Elysia chlorotica TaxID=188477 RepID=A0A433SKI4_ELYCH|nr:hypothetical protein EGW08_022693 [Elysia chlorotica]